MLGALVEPIDLDLHVQYDLWLSYSPEMAKVKRIKAAIKWLKEAFNPRRFPCFRDEFIHPKELRKLAEGLERPPIGDLSSKEPMR